MKAILTAEVPVSRVAAFAEMAWLERRPELGLLCRAALQNGNRISVSVVQSALPGLSEHGANNVIRWCVMLGLCDSSGGLSALGEEVAESDEAPVPEQGVYRLWLAKHPLMGQRVLAVERLASKRDQQWFEAIKPLDFQPDLGKVFCSVVDGRTRFMVRGFPSNHAEPGGLGHPTDARCRLRWTLDFDQNRDQWQIEGEIEARSSNGKHELRPVHHQPESLGIDLWPVIAQWGRGPLSGFGQWQESERRLAVSFADLDEEARDFFCMNIPLPRAEVPGMGAFDNVTLEEVPVGPRSNQDAQRWAMDAFLRFLAAEPGYRSRAEVREQFALLTEDTPLEAFGPTLPPHDELLEMSATDLERFWSLAAPVDLAPFPVSAEERGALQIGAPAAAPSAPEAPRGIVRIPYRGGWSMRRLVDQLLQGVVPRRVLLCDRYVRGFDNLETLKILVAALRSSAPDVAVDIWTGEEEAEFDKVKSIVGTTPRSYLQIFGRSTPHDRYLLIQPCEGPGFGWHMSNSPLHARLERRNDGFVDALRWKDLAATRVAAEELEPAFQKWLMGNTR